MQALKALSSTQLLVCAINLVLGGLQIFLAHSLCFYEASKEKVVLACY